MDIEPHNIHLKNKKGTAFQWGSGGWEAKVCTTAGVLLRYFCG
jgi:hypothetical protein